MGNAKYTGINDHVVYTSIVHPIIYFSGLPNFANGIYPIILAFHHIAIISFKENTLTDFVYLPVILHVTNHFR